MLVTSEDKDNVNAIPTEAAEKPKRGRRRKVETEAEAHAQPPQVAEIQSSETVSLESGQISDTQPSLQQDVSPQATEDAAPAVPYGSGCGNVLKAAREAQGLSMHEVSSQLRLGIRQIQAIEQDDFDKLPQPSIVRGFIRNYARLLNIDVTPILEAYQRIVPNTAPLPLSVKSNARPSVIDKPVRTIRPQRILSFFIFLILAAILAYFYIYHVKPQALKNASLALDADNISEATDQKINLPEPTVDPATPAVTEPAAVSENTGTTATSPAADAIVNNPADAAPPAEPDNLTAAIPGSTVVSSPTPAANSTTENMTLKALDPQKATLVFRVSEDSWVRIEDMQGKKVFSEVLTAGSEHSVVTEKPVNVIVGHAEVTQMTIDNQPYDLTQATRGRVARIQLK
ncbi:cytoskeleton protein RodZ [Methylophilus rhizosphaerae]|uniref:Cytoskeleton protein RodZ n=1 Tax=Methylophilus rhizosphaerae TaxID=492660 RepID=A0A1G9B1J7_9PROT|nr:RodZ domain-containing protein [Methylophilus rhizosphaerae]SDK33459.1 cytoskeleton protein RodZ [Methylophilus rhizosphaerae]